MKRARSRELLALFLAGDPHRWGAVVTLVSDAWADGALVVEETYSDE